MAIRAVFLGLVLISRSVHAQGLDALRVDARVPRETFHVGQAIEVRVGVVAAGERPRVTPPRIDGAEITPIDTAFRQIETSGIGDAVSETNLFASRFRVVPTRTGPLTIPPFAARLGDRSGVSSPIRLTIHPVPPEGRPPSYLRGVGRIEARAEAVPASVRLGQTLDYRLILNGPGARGSTQWPVLKSPGLTIEPGETDLISDPPERTFHFRVRPTAPGDWTLPSLAVATFDPGLKRYVETRAASVAVRVVDVPRLDPATLPATVADSNHAAPRSSAIAIGIGIGIATPGIVLLGARRLRSNRARRWTHRLARDFERRQTSDATTTLATSIADGLTRYLMLAIGRPPGVLTPGEVVAAVVQAVGDRPLAERAERLVARCDRVRFGRDGGDDSDSSLGAEAKAVFAGLASRRVQRRTP